MGRIVVDVALKPEILDPQGTSGGPRPPAARFDHITEVRQGSGSSSRSTAR